MKFATRMVCGFCSKEQVSGHFMLSYGSTVIILYWRINWVRPVSCFIILNFNPSFHQHQSSSSSGWCWLLSFAFLSILMYYLSTVLYFSATAPDDSLLSIIKKINLALVKTYSFLWILVLPLIIKDQCFTLHFEMNSTLFAYREFYTGSILCNMCDSKVDKNWN